MTPTLIVIMNGTTGKTVGVFLHDPISGRILLKVRPSDASLMQIFNLWRDKPVIEQFRQTVRGRKLTRRVRALPTDMDYGKLLADRFIKAPYKVRFSSTVETQSLDALLDSTYQSLVDVKPAPATVPDYVNPFKQ